MRFTELKIDQSLQQAVRDEGYEETTRVQTQAIPPALKGQDIMGCAPTGTGKTLAFLLPALEHLLRHPAQSKSRLPRVVVLEPTRELAVQIAGEARKLTNHTSLRTVAVYGGSSIKRQTQQLRRGVDIVVATPGRLMDHMRRKNVRYDNLEFLVLDEADRMLDMGFLPDIRHIVGRMPRQRQTMLFSATIPPEIRALARRFQQEPVRVEIDIDKPPETINQALYPVAKHLKVKLLLAILETMDVDSMLIFTRTKREADIVTLQLRRSRAGVACIHGDFSQHKRTKALEGFRSGKYQVLVATNVAARGLDVEGITHVINYDVPDHPENYIHRIGRTARADAEGDAITLVSPDDEVLVRRIEQMLGYEIQRKTLEGFNYDVPTPSWARPSAETLMREATKSQSLADRWRSMA